MASYRYGYILAKIILSCCLIKSQDCQWIILGSKLLNGHCSKNLACLIFDHSLDLKKKYEYTSDDDNVLMAYWRGHDYLDNHRQLTDYWGLGYIEVSLA